MTEELKMKKCPKCGAEMEDGSVYCLNCGEPVMQRREMTKEELPDKFRPLGAWVYFGYGLLFSIPLVGFILLIVFSVGGAKNVNLKNYARSYFCGYILLIVVMLIFGITGGFSVLANMLAFLA